MTSKTIIMDALAAIDARKEGIFDNPLLLALGPLSTTEADILRIKEKCLDALGIGVRVGEGKTMPGIFEIGSENDKGEHQRGVDGWPYSIYLRSDDIGCCDRVLCHGIQGLPDAEQLLELVNASSNPFRV